MIIARDNSNEAGEGESEYLRELEGKIIEACRTIKRIMSAVLDDFYPMTEEMVQAAAGIGIECKGDVTHIKLSGPSDDLLNFIQRIKIKISEDFKEISGVFFILLEQVKEVEKSFATEFGGNKPLKEVEYFEMKINQEVGFIAESFHLHATIQEIKKVVIDKLENIKSLVAKKKKEETKKHRVAIENIEKLKKKINEVENRARKMSKKAERYQEAALRDGHTGLFTRGAFDFRLKEALRAFKENGKGFSLILFDVDKLKTVNDRLGHVAGDKVLKKVSECLLETFRKDDFVARYGGDEFVVLIEGFTQKMCLDRIAVFRENLKKRRFVSYKEGEINLTVSAGATQVCEGDTPEIIIERADRAMYALKHRSNPALSGKSIPSSKDIESVTTSKTSIMGKAPARGQKPMPYEKI
jgi:diguanylate cyclase